MHLGEEDSLLTDSASTTAKDEDETFCRAGPLMDNLVECLRALVDSNDDDAKKPILVLNGDILELALTTTNKATMVFEQFMAKVFPENAEDWLFSLKNGKLNLDDHFELKEPYE